MRISMQLYNFVFFYMFDLLSTVFTNYCFSNVMVKHFFAFAPYFCIFQQIVVFIAHQCLK